MKKDKTMTMIGTVMTAGGVPIILIWATMLVIGNLVNESVPTFFSVFLIAGVIGAFLSLANGIMIIKNSAATKKVQLVFAAATALLSLPGAILFFQMQWYFAAIPVFLFAFGPSAYYLVKIHDAYNERRM